MIRHNLLFDECRDLTFPDCRKNTKSGKAWKTRALAHTESNVANWEKCAQLCFEWRGSNGEMCEFWQYHSSSDSFLYRKKCYFKRGSSSCAAPTLATRGVLLNSYKHTTAGSCPPLSGSTCRSGKRYGKLTTLATKKNPRIVTLVSQNPRRKNKCQ